MDLPEPITREDKFLHNIIDGTPNIEDIEPISREDIYLKHIALNGGGGDITGTVPISKGGTGATTAESARANLEVEGYQLYLNTDGTNSTIILSDDYSNYNRIKVFFNDNGAYNSCEFDATISHYVVLTNVYMYNKIDETGEQGFYIHSCLLNFSGDSATFSRNGYVNVNDQGEVKLFWISNEGIKVNKILGYKY